MVNDSFGWGGFFYKVLVFVFVLRILSEAGVFMNYFFGFFFLGINDFLCIKVSIWNIGKMLCYVMLCLGKENLRWLFTFFDFDLELLGFC